MTADEEQISRLYGRGVNSTSRGYTDYCANRWRRETITSIKIGFSHFTSRQNNGGTARVEDSLEATEPRCVQDLCARWVLDARPTSGR
jgi:hypothetical protein